LGLEDVVTVLECNRLRWHNHVLRKDDRFVVESVTHRCRPKRTWKEVVEGDMKNLKLVKKKSWFVVNGDD